MNVSSVTAAHSHGLAIGRGGHDKQASRIGSAAQESESNEPAAAADTVDLNAPVETGEEPGVLRLLRDGHFKGVADVRLRIVHHERLAAGDAEATQVAAGAAVTDLVEATGTQLDGVAGVADLTEDQLASLAEYRETFETSVATAAETFEGAEGAAGQALTQDLQAAFDALMTSLGAMAPPPPDPLAEGQPDVQDPPQLPEAAESSELQTALSTLQDAFAAALEKLADSLANTTLLPELSPPSGNGVAYEKFLAQYAQLQSPEQGVQAASPDGVDVEA